MSDIKKTFHEIAVESILFKGQYDWYFCFLKSEKIAHVLALLSEKMSPHHKEWFMDVLNDASDLPYHIAHFAAGDTHIQTVLAEVLSLLSGVRISSTRGYISKDTAQYIAAEYERIAERLASANKPSPFVSPQDFSVPDFLNRPKAPNPLSLETIPETAPESRAFPKNQRKQYAAPASGPGHLESGSRSAAILNFVVENKAVSIKDIRTAITGCSEKTIQRELANLISQGLIKREGERRWSVYKPV